MDTNDITITTVGTGTDPTSGTVTWPVPVGTPVVPYPTYPGIHIPSVTIPQYPDPQPALAWEDVMMWIAGYLSALKGQPITDEHIKEIIKKFGEADPNRFSREWISGFQVSAGSLGQDFSNVLANQPGGYVTQTIDDNKAAEILSWIQGNG